MSGIVAEWRRQTRVTDVTGGPPATSRPVPPMCALISKPARLHGMDVFFSDFAANLGGPKNPLYQLHERVKAEGSGVIDLVRGNVNEHGIIYPPEILSEILLRAAEAARIYRPDSLGQRPAREAIAAYYGGLKVTADRVVLTPGTSVSYWYCFKLLTESGDEILCPQPSYPLFDYIARLAGIYMRPYRLEERAGWAIDLEHLENQISTGTRAIILISPHNPTGMVAGMSQLEALADIAARHALPIISDEVFSEFLFGADPFPRVAATAAPLVFTLNGFSKMFALPGMKIGWMAVTGEDSLVKKSVAALELISDTFLPVNEVAQFAVPGIFHLGREFLKRYKDWVRACRDAAVAGLKGLTFVEPQGGFYITLPIARDEEEAATGLLKNEGILVHPGYFYDIPPDHLVMTFIDDPHLVRSHFEKIARACA
jgi:aspartate/methionine/tyrosine aminotransferase